MDFPPLDDPRWDRLLGAVTDQRPTVGDPGAPLGTSFPAQLTPGQNESRDHQGASQLIDLDTYA